MAIREGKTDSEREGENEMERARWKRRAGEKGEGGPR